MYKRPVVETAKLIDVYAQEWLRITNLDSAKPKDLMPYLIEKRVFNHDHREGLPLRAILRQLDQIGELGLIRGLNVERKSTNRLWSIKRIETGESN
jgi:hypothetical protein